MTFTLPPSYLWYLDQDSLRTIASKFLVKMAIASALAYLLKNFAVEPAKTIVTTDTNAKAVNANQKIKDAL